MVAGAVVALAVVLPDELPVPFLDDGALMRDLRLAQPVRQQIGLDHRAHRREIGRLACQADENIAADGFAGDRLQTELALVEALGHLAREQQPAVEFVGPLVIGADKLGGGALVGVADATAAMPAGIVEGVDLALLVAHQHDGIIADLHGHEAAGLWQLALMAGEQPVAIPDQLHVELEVVGVGVEGLLEREALAAAFQPLHHVVARIHVLSSLAKD